MKRMNWKLTTLTLGLLGSALFVSCIVYGMLVPASMHFSAALEQLLPGFRWLTPGSVVLGVIETFLYGAYAGLLLALIYNWLARRVDLSAAQ
jgi:hypothetical protein